MMTKLQPAGFFSSIGTFFSPKELSVQVRSEVLSSGHVQVTPVFLIDGQEVPPDLVTLDKQQTILGYTVNLTPHAQRVHEKTQGRSTRLSKLRAAEFLKDLDGSGVTLRSSNGRVKPRIEAVKPDVTLELHEGDSLRVVTEMQTSEGAILEKPTDLNQLIKDEGWYTVGDDFLRVDLTHPSIDQKLIIEGGDGWFTGDDVPRIMDSIVDNQSKLGDVQKNDVLKDLEVFSGEPKTRVNVDGDSTHISIAPTLAYSGTKGREYQQSLEELEAFLNQGKEYKRIPDGWVKISSSHAERFRQSHEELKRKVGSLDQITGQKIPEILSRMAQTKRRDQSFLSSPWNVYFSEQVKDAHRLVENSAQLSFRLNIVESDGRSLLELDPIYNQDGFKVSHEFVHEATQKGEKWIRRGKTWVKTDKDKFENVEKQANKLELGRTPTGFTFPAMQREKVIDVFSRLGSIEHSQAYGEFIRKLADYKQIEETQLPESLRDEIEFRSYQQHGFNWLAFLHRFGLNGILADDMGLGKTIQTLAMIHRAIELSRANYPSLIICPASVVANWAQEIEKFFRNSTAIVYTGSSRGKQLDAVEEIDQDLPVCPGNSPIFITSYNIARLDQEKLGRVCWLYVVVDEGHNIKNPNAVTTKAIKTLVGQNKLALTGTPIQNNLEELWSLFDFAMPGFLGARTEFRTDYGSNGKVDTNKIGKLKKRIHPFLLRRLKKDVAKDLPEKTVVDRLVELTPIQVRLYKEALNSSKYKEMLEHVDKDGVGRSTLMILEIIAKLRTICNHPVLAVKEQENGRIDYKTANCEDSGKLDALQELIEEIVEGEEHRALLFSQSTRALDLIEYWLNEWNVAYLRLDGNTPTSKRQPLCAQFNSTPAITLFLISTKAGGTGLNLTGADTVIFYDHDWNPANDAQAQDRAYRIGQKRNVTVYRLISKGTIEERIIERQTRKQTLADEVIGSDINGFKDLSKDELLSLFRFDGGET